MDNETFVLLVFQSVKVLRKRMIAVFYSTHKYYLFEEKYLILHVIVDVEKIKFIKVDGEKIKFINFFISTTFLSKLRNAELPP